MKNKLYNFKASRWLSTSPVINSQSVYWHQNKLHVSELTTINWWKQVEGQASWTYLIWPVTVSHQDLLFLRLLSLSGNVSFSLFRQFALQGFSRDRVSWVFRVSEFFCIVCSSCSELQQQPSATGKASSVKVWVWNREEQANRTLTASCRRGLFFCCSSRPPSASAHRKHSSFSPELNSVVLEGLWTL